jgi:hypothetical protein
MSTERFALQRRIATGLGCFSIGLGLLQLTAPGRLGRMLGAERRVGARLPRDPDATGSSEALVLRASGVRQVLSGIGILTRPHPAAWLWSRVAGDAMDLSLLGVALASRRSNRARLVGASAVVLAVAALDVFASLEFTRMRHAGRPHQTLRRRVPLESARQRSLVARAFGTSVTAAAADE